jgi:hypothetical protein
MMVKSLLGALAVAATVFFSTNTAKAQGGDGCPSIVLPNGTVLTCTVAPNGTKTYVDAAGNSYPATTGGSGTFTVTNSSTNPCEAFLNPVAININSVAGPFGNVNTTLDLSRPATQAHIVSQTVAQQFPATEDFYFYAIATVSSLPGQYRSIQQFHFSSRNVRSFAPHKNERFTQEGRVDFEDVNRPGRIVFSVVGTTITLN